MEIRTRILAGAGVILIAIAAALLVPRWLPVDARDPAEFHIEPYVSPRDQDADGVDDQTDILQSARAYVQTNPTYASAYYDGGRPDDGRGVCTDVVDQALLGAGYDLRELVAQDQQEHPEAYDIETPDPNIDFRRVANLRVWFSRHARQLTCDPANIAAWQGGDIVCWDQHIGVVSDRRNKDGVALVIHHSGPLQAHFEEDVLTASTWGPIVGHYRLS